VSTEESIRSATSALTRAMAGLLRAIDEAGDDGAAAREIPEDLPIDLERLVARLNAARGFEH
jgi:hypothetical protein